MTHTSNWQSKLYRDLVASDLEHWIASLMPRLQDWQAKQVSAQHKMWQKQLAQLPQLSGLEVDLKNGVIVNCEPPLSEPHIKHLTAVLKQYMPWRKGPFSVCGIDIDTEWRSDMKWLRVLPHISPLTDRKVLDVGCGSAYHCMRMLGEGAKQVFGIDPTDLFFYQYQVIQSFIQRPNLHFIPVGLEDLPPSEAFDTVFCMGVLYHRRDPMESLQQLKQQLKPSGELVLETLVIEGDENTVLVPGERYAQMRNVWFIPSTKALVRWLEKLHFKNVRVVDCNQTSTEEQRATDWMTNHSLIDFLDPQEPNKTIEGYPAPVRATIIANR